VLIDVLGPEFAGDGESSSLINEHTPLTVDFIAGYAPEVFTEAKLRELHDRLSRIPKP
jgi:hypothetical protein